MENNYAIRKKWLTASYKIPLYKDKTLKRKSFVLKKGVRVKALKCYISGKTISFYAKTSNGKAGWFRSLKTCKQPFKEILYAT